MELKLESEKIIESVIKKENKDYINDFIKFDEENTNRGYFTKLALIEYLVKKVNNVSSVKLKMVWEK